MWQNIKIVRQGKAYTTAVPVHSRKWDLSEVSCVSALQFSDLKHFLSLRISVHRLVGSVLVEDKDLDFLKKHMFHYKSYGIRLVNPIQPVEF